MGKRYQSRVVEQQTAALYDRFKNDQITVKDLLRGLSYFVANEK